MGKEAQHQGVAWGEGQEQIGHQGQVPIRDRSTICNSLLRLSPASGSALPKQDRCKTWGMKCPHGCPSPMTDGSWFTYTWMTSPHRRNSSKSLHLHCLLEVPTGFNSAASVETCLIASCAGCLPFPILTQPYLGFWDDLPLNPCLRACF